MKRLLNDVEKLATKYPHLRFIAQTGPDAFESDYINTQQWMQTAQFERHVAESDVFISHAGMGNILLAAQYQKPIIIMPRLASLNEHINDHQASTAKAMQDKSFIRVVNNGQQLKAAMFDVIQNLGSGINKNTPLDIQQAEHRNDLISAIKEFIDEH